MEERTTKVLKTLQFRGKRRSFRLERVFWECLRSIAKRRMVRVGQLVEEIAQHTHTNNLTSAVRVECMLDLERQLVSSRVKGGGVGPDVVEWCPAPCLLLSEAGTVLGFNRAFQSLLEDADHAIVGQRFTEVFRVQTAISFETFWTNLQRRPRRVLSAHVVLRGTGRLKPAQAIFCAGITNRGEFLGATVWLRTAAVDVSHSETAAESIQKPAD